MRATEESRKTFINTACRLCYLLGLINPTVSEEVTAASEVLTSSVMLGLQDKTGELVWRFSFIQIVNGFSSLAQLTSFSESYKRSIRELSQPFAEFEKTISNKIVSVRSNRVQYRYALDFTGLHMVLAWLLYTNRSTSKEWAAALAPLIHDLRYKPSGFSTIPLSVFKEHSGTLPSNQAPLSAATFSNLEEKIKSTIAAMPPANPVFRCCEMFDSVKALPEYRKALEVDSLGQALLQALEERNDGPFSSSVKSQQELKPEDDVAKLLASLPQDFSIEARRARPAGRGPRSPGLKSPRSASGSTPRTRERKRRTQPPKERNTEKKPTTQKAPAKKKRSAPPVAEAADSDSNEDNHPLSDSRWARSEWETPVPYQPRVPGTGAMHVIHSDDNDSDDTEDEEQSVSPLRRIRTSRRLAEAEGTRKPIRPGLFVFNGPLEAQESDGPPRAHEAGEKRSTFAGAKVFGSRKRLKTIGNMVARELVNPEPYYGLASTATSTPSDATAMNTSESSEEYVPLAATLIRPLFKKSVSAQSLWPDFTETPYDSIYPLTPLIQDDDDDDDDDGGNEKDKEEDDDGDGGSAGAAGDDRRSGATKGHVGAAGNGNVAKVEERVKERGTEAPGQGAASNASSTAVAAAPSPTKQHQLKEPQGEGSTAADVHSTAYMVEAKSNGGALGPRSFASEKQEVLV